MWVWVAEGFDEKIDVFGRRCPDGTVELIDVATGAPHCPVKHWQC